MHIDFRIVDGDLHIRSSGFASLLTGKVLSLRIEDAADHATVAEPPPPPAPPPPKPKAKPREPIAEVADDVADAPEASTAYSPTARGARKSIPELVVDAVGEIGDATARQVAERTGKGLVQTRTLLSRLVRMGLLAKTTLGYSMPKVKTTPATAPAPGPQVSTPGLFTGTGPYARVYQYLRESGPASFEDIVAGLGAGASPNMVRAGVSGLVRDNHIVKGPNGFVIAVAPGKVEAANE